MEYALKNIKTNRIMSTRYSTEDQAILAKRFKENGNKYKIVKRNNNNEEWKGIKE